MTKPWLKSYPKGVRAEVNVHQYSSVIELFEEAVHKFRDRTAFTNMGAELTYEDINYLSADFASFFQNVAKLKKGDRIAIQMPNCLQYPVVLFAAIRAGLVVVNTNPLYTEREMKKQFQDAGCKAIVILANCAHNLQEILHETQIETVVVTEVGDMLGFPKSFIVNSAVKYVKKMVPSYHLPNAYSFYQALDLGSETRFKPEKCTADDLLFLQYTGGTTGISKGAELTHGNLIANVMQTLEWLKVLLEEGEEIAICALPLYHIFCLMVNAFLIFAYGGKNIMITNPRDMTGFIKTLRNEPFTVFLGLNTLFNGLMNNPDFMKIDFSKLKISVAGGMALQVAVAQRWMKMTNTRLVEGYGLTETSPVACVNPINGGDRIGTIGLPVPNTEIRLCDDDGKDVPLGAAGEIWIKGPQVMRGYWQQPEETKRVMAPGGWFKSGDIGVMDADGFIKIVDRKKDMILVSGFNVYPNEVEDVVAHHPKVLEVAAVGVPDPHSSEAVKIFVVKRDPSLTEEELRAYCKENLTGYKLPKHIEFRTDLPKSPVGKILRRELRSANA